MPPGRSASCGLHPSRVRVDARGWRESAYGCDRELWGKSAIQAGAPAAAICMALRSFKRRTFKLPSSRRDTPRFRSELDLTSGSASSWVHTYVGIVAGSASRGGVAHIGVASGHASPHLVAGNGRQARRRVVLVTGTPMGCIIPQLAGVVTQHSEHQHGFESYLRCRCIGVTTAPLYLLVLRQPMVVLRTLSVCVSSDTGGCIGRSLVYVR